MRFFLLSLLLLLHRSTMPAQSPAYVHYGVSEGLPSNKIYCALQDYRGFVWFGTDKGLARFDGTHFQVFGVKDGLPDPEVLSLFEDSHHRLWISCFSQRPCYMLDGRLFTATNDSLLGKIKVESSLWLYTEDSDHRVWITSKTSLVYIFDGERIQEKKFPSSVLRMEEIGKLKFALGTKSIIQDDLGLIYDLHPASNIFNSIAVSGNQILYVFAGALVLLEWTGEKIVEVDRLHYTEGRVFTDKQGRFWLCPNSQSAVCFENVRHDLSMPVQYLKQEQVNAMMEDKHGTLWFCTSGRGVFGLSPGKASTYSKADGLLIDNITALARDAYGTIFAGDDGGNLYKFSGRTRQRIALDTVNTYNRCRQIVCLPGDSVWVANDKDLFRLQGDQVYAMHHKNHLSGFKSILAKPSRLWYGNHNSFGFLKSDQPDPTLIMYQRTTALGEDADGNIWTGGLDRFYSQEDSFQFNWVNKFPLLKGRIIAVENAGAGKIWVVTPDAGLLLGKVQGGKLIDLEMVNQHLDHPIENIQSIFVEPSPPHRLWMATNSGVYGLNPANWNVVQFDQHDGLADNDVNCVVVALDTLWAGTVAGLSCFPLTAPNGDDDFGTFVTGLHYQSAGRLVQMNLLDSLGSFHRVVLPSDAAMVTLNLAGLNYRSQGNLVYECITTRTLPPIRWWTRQNLFNFLKNSFRNLPDTTLIDGNTLNFGISFPSGSYQLQITAITAQGVASQHPDHWTIIMRPSWYSTIWFDLLIWASIAYALWRIIRARTVYKKLNVAVSELQLQALQSQINPHFVGNSINAIQQFFYPPNPAAASNYIELFTRLLRRTILLSERHFNPFKAELAYDHDYLEMIKQRFGDRFQYEIQGADTVPGDLPFPSMLLQPILENATIHGLAPEGISRLVLAFSYRNKQLRCTVTDNGMGYKASRARPTTKPVEHKSKGLELLQKKVTAFNQSYDIDLLLELSDLSEDKPPGMGTRVLIALNPEKIKSAQRLSQDAQ